MGTEVLRCVHMPVKNGAPLAQCASAADWQCVKCGLGFCHRHILWHRRRQAAEPAPYDAAARAQVSLAVMLQAPLKPEAG